MSKKEIVILSTTAISSAVVIIYMVKKLSEEKIIYIENPTTYKCVYKRFGKSCSATGQTKEIALKRAKESWSK